jgi:hypothetical protein
MNAPTLAPLQLRHTDHVRSAAFDRTQSSSWTTVVLLSIASIYWIGSLLAVIFGHVALNGIDDWNGWIGGKAVVSAIIVLGYVGLGLLALLMVRGTVIALADRRSTAST